MVERERLLLPDAELSRPALDLAQRFVQRWDLHACQLDDGSYVCVHEQLNVGHLFDHLRGEITLETYLLDQQSLVRFLVLDADDAQGWERLGQLARELAEEDVTAYLERSRRGGHLWLFLAQAGLKPHKIHDDQAWYSCEQWQQWERQADEDIAADRIQ